jgi:hypothetical protein
MCFVQKVAYELKWLLYCLVSNCCVLKQSGISSMIDAALHQQRAATAIDKRNPDNHLNVPRHGVAWSIVKLSM